MQTMETAQLFGSPALPDALVIQDADIRFVHAFFPPDQTRAYFERLRDETPWAQPRLRIWGKEHVQPRLSCWIGDPDTVYRFSGKRFFPHPWTETLTSIRHAVQAACGAEFNSVLLNLYRDESDSIAMHSDDEPELGATPVIASLSLGATRMFRLTHRRRAAAPVTLALTDGSLLIMAGNTQECWLHGIRKEVRHTGPRINLTFRRIVSV